DLLKLYGLVFKYYENHPIAGVGLLLWDDLQVLFESHEGETISGEVLYMFTDVCYPLSIKLMERMLTHKLEIDMDIVGNDMTTAEQLIQFIKNQLATTQIQAFSQTLKRTGPMLEEPSSKRQKSTDAPILSLPDDPQSPVVSSPPSYGTRRKSLGRKHLPKPKSTLQELDLDADTQTFITIVSTEDSDDEAPSVWSALVGWEVIPTHLGDINALYRMDRSTSYFTTLREILHIVDRQDLLKLFLRTMTFLPLRHVYYLFYLCYVLSLYPFTKRYAQPYFFSCLIRQAKKVMISQDLGNSYVYDPNLNSFDCPPDSYHPPHPTYETYSYDSYGNASQFGYDFSLSSCLIMTQNRATMKTNILIHMIHRVFHNNILVVPACQPMNQDSYNSNSLGFNQPQPPQSPVIHQPPQELSIQEMEDLKQQYIDELKHLSNLEYRDEINIAELKENFNGMSIEIRKKEKLQQLEQWAYLSTHPSKRFNSFCYDDDDEDYTLAVTPVLSTEEPDNSLSMGDEHLDTIPATKSDEFIKSSVENLIPIPNQIEDFSESNNEVSSIDDDSFSIDNIDYVEASPSDYELVSLEVMEIVIPKTKSSSTSLNSLLEETNTFDNSLPEFKTFCFGVEEISSGSTTTHYDISPLEYEVFYDHVKEISSGSPTIHSDSSLYASFIFDLSINPLPPADRSDFYEFIDELIPFISPPEYDCFLFKVEPNSRDFTKDVVVDISPTKEPQVHNALPTHPTLQLNMKF
nr:hypothetical protein [Tanacetum cinerariifolium]